MSTKIDKKIVGVSVVKDEEEKKPCDEVTDSEKDCEGCDYKLSADSYKLTDHGGNVKRPEVLPAAIYKVKDPTKDTNIYCSISNMGGKPFEIFVNSRHTESQQWVSAMTVLISLAFRAGVPAEFIGQELQQIVDSNPYFYKGKSGCTVSHIGRVILRHCEAKEFATLVEETESIVSDAEPIDTGINKVGDCPLCGGEMVLMDGCPTCLSCGHSKCG